MIYKACNFNHAYSNAFFLNALAREVWKLPLSKNGKKIYYFRFELKVTMEEDCPTCGHTTETEETFYGESIEEAYQQYVTEMFWDKKTAEEKRKEVLNRFDPVEWASQDLWGY